MISIVFLSMNIKRIGKNELSLKKRESSQDGQKNKKKGEHDKK